MKEYYSLPAEYSTKSQEYTPIGKKTATRPKEVNKRLEKTKKKLLRIFCTSAGALVLAPSLLIQSAATKGELPIEEPPNINEVNIQPSNQMPDNPNNDVPKEETPIKEMIFIECPDCHGTGIYCPGDPDFGYDRGNGQGYAGCGGTGYSICPDSWCHNGIKTCQVCGGSGCQNCNNTGIVDCEFCANTGIAPCISADSHTPCNRCQGKGEILQEAY